MMALDDKLADIFKLQSGEKKGKKGALGHFDANWICD